MAGLSKMSVLISREMALFPGDGHRYEFYGIVQYFCFVAYAGIAYEYGLVSVTVFWSTVPACISLWLGGRWRRTGASLPSNIWNSVIVSLFVK